MSFLSPTIHYKIARNMSGPLAVVTMMVLVITVSVLGLSNRSLRATLEEERTLSLKSIVEKSDDLSSCMTETKSLEEKIKELTEQQAKLTSEVKERSEELNQLQEQALENQKMTEEINDLNARIHQLTVDGEQLEGKLQSAQKQVGALEATRKDLSEQLATAQKEIADANAKAGNAIPQDKPAPVVETAPAAQPAV
ncbi:coiled-coil domain-containing protein 30-like isoform X2 [Penaeus chinensis]|uniref:coiled-coil domain-containing protein 30-like isoform X2 n=1 Tax=Penaeus chinensis TaxID=139456 RepID=UPI001FB75F0C|nr:coiled-coil domain-containing protein 30-like isoform X2 [Penaeus chinensis]XP_047498099.1 coiled-coil domain-containing protein 30-like isoform X2 [Penaeus chinensis]XP_047498100.1 coiled-coil domain-containing protein 30-like isoform X2 [Penaeus chinensis]